MTSRRQNRTGQPWPWPYYAEACALSSRGTPHGLGQGQCGLIRAYLVACFPLGAPGNIGRLFFTKYADTGGKPADRRKRHWPESRSGSGQLAPECEVVRSPSCCCLVLRGLALHGMSMGWFAARQLGFMTPTHFDSFCHSASLLFEVPPFRLFSVCMGGFVFLSWLLGNCD